MEQRQVYNQSDSKRSSKYSHVMSEEELEPEDVEDKIQELVKYVSVEKISVMCNTILNFKNIFELIKFLISVRRGRRRRMSSTIY